jgi:hypothetical protein
MARLGWLEKWIAEGLGAAGIFAKTPVREDQKYWMASRKSNKY